MEEIEDLRHRIYKNEQTLKSMIPTLTYSDKIKFRELNDETKDLTARFNRLDLKNKNNIL